MKWYRVNVNYYSVDYENKTLETSSFAGRALEEAHARYVAEIARGERCKDNADKPVRIDLIEYNHNEKTGDTVRKLIKWNY